MLELSIAAAQQQSADTDALCGLALAVGIILIVVGAFAPFASNRGARLRLVVVGLVVSTAAFAYLAMS